MVRRGHVGLLLRDPLVPLDDATPDIRPPLGIEEGLEGGSHRFGLRVETPGRDESLKLFGEGIWYAYRNLYRHADSIPGNEGTVRA